MTNVPTCVDSCIELGRLAENLAEQLERFAQRTNDHAPQLAGHAAHLAQRLHFVAAGASLASPPDLPRISTRLREIQLEARSILSERPPPLAR